MYIGGGPTVIVHCVYHMLCSSTLSCWALLAVHSTSPSPLPCLHPPPQIRVVKAFRHGVDGANMQQATANPSVQVGRLHWIYIEML